jgi:hypothetical protein
MAERCNGTDPAYPGLKCYLDKGHENNFLEDCEFFTDAVASNWRRQAMDFKDQLIDAHTELVELRWRMEGLEK